MLTKEKFRLTVRWLCFALLVLAGTLRLAAEPSVRGGVTSSARRILSQDKVRQAFLSFRRPPSGFYSVFIIPERAVEKQCSRRPFYKSFTLFRANLLRQRQK